MTESVQETQLVRIVKESNLEPTKAQYILDNFKDYFQLAAEWEAKSKTIVVTRVDQSCEMQMARTGRLFLRDKRLAIENSRKKLKEESLREGKAIDGIANVLKALIVPIEEYLDEQEHFAEREQERKDALHRAEVEKRMQEENIAKEKAAAEEREKIKIENERLKKEAEERDRLAAEERKKQDAILAEERAKATAERKRQDELHAEERKKQDAIHAEERRKDEEERKRQEAIRAEERRKEELAREEERKKASAEKEAADKKAREERAKAEAEERERKRLEELLKNQVECPNCKHKFQVERKG